MLLWGQATGTPAWAAGERPPAFLVRTAAGMDVAGPLGKVGPDWAVRLGGDRPALVAGAELVAVRRSGADLPAFPTGPQVVLAGGDRLPLHPDAPVVLRGEQLTVTPAPPLRPAAGEVIAVPVAHVALLWLRTPAGETVPEVRIRRLLATRRPRDVVLLHNGDEVAGTVTAFDARGACHVQREKQAVQVPAGRIAAVAFSSALLIPPRFQGPYARVVLAGGARLSLATAGADTDAGVLRGTTGWRAQVAFPFDRLVALSLRQGPAVYLSEVKPARHEHTPFLGTAWPYVNDGSVAGGPLALAGDTYDAGVGTHSASRLTYALDGKFRRFEAAVGLDRHTGRAGSVRVDVLVDGKSQNLGGEELTGSRPPLLVRADVSGARELTLVTDFGARGDVQDHVNWADARLVK